MKRCEMKRIHRISWAFVVLLASVCVEVGAEPDNVPRDQARPGTYVGISSCANGFCHGAIEPLGETAVLQNEYPTWMLGPHRQSYQTLFDERSKEIVETLEGPGAQASKMKICRDCHVLNVTADEIYVEDGISCEGCHGAAGGWRDRHFEEGWTYRQSLRAGMIDLRDSVTRGEVCLTCHLGDAERKVDHRLIAAGHPRLFFELDNAAGAMPRHWKVRQAGHGVRAWATGQAVTFRESLEQLARHASGESTWPEFSEYNCQSCHHSLAGSEWRRQPGYRFEGGMPRWSRARWVVLRNLIETFAAGELEGFDTALGELSRQVSRMSDAGAVAAQARELAGRVDTLTERLSKVRWSKEDAEGMMQRLVADREAFLADVAAAEQLAFALQSLMSRRVELDRRELRSPLASGIDAVFAALEDPDAFDRERLATLLRDLDEGSRGKH